MLQFKAGSQLQRWCFEQWQDWQDLYEYGTTSSYASNAPVQSHAQGPDTTKPQILNFFLHLLDQLHNLISLIELVRSFNRKQMWRAINFFRIAMESICILKSPKASNFEPLEKVWHSLIEKCTRWEFPVFVIVGSLLIRLPFCC